LHHPDRQQHRSCGFPKLPPAAALAAGPSSSASPASTSGLKRLASQPNLAKQRSPSRKAIKPPPSLPASAASATPAPPAPTPGPSSGAQAQVPPRVANGGGSSVAAVVRTVQLVRRAHAQPNGAGITAAVPHGLTGLRNLGNTCYLNSTVQCLRQYAMCWLLIFLQGRRGPANMFSVVVQALWAGRLRLRQPVPTSSTRTIGRHAEAFAGNEQQDSRSFYCSSLDGLHEDLNRAPRRPPPELETKESLPDVDATRSGPGPGTALFNESIMGGAVSAAAGSAPRCRRDQSAVKKIDIWRLPPYLLIHFKRFSCDRLSSRGRKLNTLVDYPISNLDMSAYHSSEARPKHSLVYNLYGVSNHFGSMECGHYTAFCRNSNLNRWFKFDDETVTEMRSGEIRSVSNYILFYSRLAKYFSSVFIA
uniref:Ubiquitin carboxyl-terminal hydrolase n=1 Tax=Macrostomum lignano TaxID=282301 RepID=A0A1I8FBW0_9PLAT